MILEGNDCVEFLKLINDINQKMKTISNTNFWVNDNGRIFARAYGQYPSLVEYEIVIDNYTKKRKEAVEPLLEIFKTTKFEICCTEFFDFYKEKNSLIKVEISENFISIYSNILGVLCFEYGKNKIKSKNIDNMDEEIFSCYKGNKLNESIINKGNCVFNILLDIDNDDIIIDPDFNKYEEASFITFKINKKYIIGLSNKYKKLKSGIKEDDVSKLTFKLYTTNMETVYVLKIILNNKDCNITNYYGIVDF